MIWSELSSLVFMHRPSRVSVGRVYRPRLSFLDKVAGAYMGHRGKNCIESPAASRSGIGLIEPGDARFEVLGNLTNCFGRHVPQATDSTNRSVISRSVMGAPAVAVISVKTKP